MNRRTWAALAVALMIAFLDGASRAGDGGVPGPAPLPALPPPPPPREKTPWEKVCEAAQRLWRQRERIVGRLLGRVLGSVVKKGMTEEEVKDLLGKDAPAPSSVTLAGGFITEFAYSPHLGLAVVYHNADPCTRTPKDTLWVVKITYEPLLGWPWTSP
jgi:hypothetical protein